MVSYGKQNTKATMYIYIYIHGELRETDVFNEDKTLRIF